MGDVDDTDSIANKKTHKITCSTTKHWVFFLFLLSLWMGVFMAFNLTSFSLFSTFPPWVFFSIEETTWNDYTSNLACEK